MIESSDSSFGLNKPVFCHSLFFILQYNVLDFFTEYLPQMDVLLFMNGVSQTGTNPLFFVIKLLDMFAKYHLEWNIAFKHIIYLYHCYKWSFPVHPFAVLTFFTVFSYNSQAMTLLLWANLQNWSKLLSHNQKKHI